MGNAQPKEKKEKKLFWLRSAFRYPRLTGEIYGSRAWHWLRRIFILVVVLFLSNCKLSLYVPFTPKKRHLQLIIFFFHSEDLYFSGLKFISFTSLVNKLNSTLNSKGSESPGIRDYFYNSVSKCSLLVNTFLDYLMVSWLENISGELRPKSFKPSEAARIP